MNYKEQRYRQRVMAGKTSNDLMLLMAICLLVFVGLAFMKAVWFFNYADDKDLARALFAKNVLGLFTMPADLSQLGGKPWAPITSMFVVENNDVWKVFSNMFWLWSFGFILQDLTGGKKIIPVFLYGAFGGIIAFVLAYLLVPSLRDYQPIATLGAVPCGVMAVAVVTTLTSPGYRLFPMIAGGIPLWVLTVLYLISSFATVSISDSGMLITLAAAALTGLLFVFSLRRGYDWSEWMNRFFYWFNNLFNPDKPARGKQTKDELFYNATTIPFNKTAKLTQERVDLLLDKINQQGYGSLTEEEKELLKRASEEEL
ncbi:MAG: rhomboid family intramembrane serine protease [Chitinophagaceae bacterium]|jgi:membrane associated rhomboid family serine protease|nr:rhomboid family intramembrane serine protease [Chitinophagaceae bacterium]MBP6589283.1 rhomboid family intramembrane serine protease [Chitinophagaceae bacterium]